MAQPVAIKYLGAVRVTAGVTYLAADIITAFTGANVIQAKSDIDLLTGKLKDTYINVSINNGVMFHFENGETCYIASPQSFVFDKDFTAAVGTYVAI